MGELLHKDLLPLDISRTLTVFHLLQKSGASSLWSDETGEGVVKRITGLLPQLFSFLFFLQKHFHFLLLSHTGQDPSGNTASFQERRCTHFILIWKLSGAVCRMIWIICHCGDRRLYQPAGSPDVALLQGDTLQLKCVSGRIHDDRDRIQKGQTLGTQTSDSWEVSRIRGELLEERRGEQITLTFWQEGGSKFKWGRRRASVMCMHSSCSTAWMPEAKNLMKHLLTVDSPLHLVIVVLAHQESL